MSSTQILPLPRQGFILTEACVSMVLIGLVLGVASLLLTQHARATQYFLDYRRAQLAAESCVERLRTGVLEMVESNFTDEAGIAYEIRVMDANSVWRPLRRVIVSAAVNEHKTRPARYAIHSYLASPTPSRRDGQ
jgi:Tfp pilus assembly protein PilX